MAVKKNFFDILFSYSDYESLFMAFKRLYYVKEILKSEIAALNQYLEENIINIRYRQGKLDAELKTALKGIEDKEYEQHIIDSFLDENLIYYNEFPGYFNNSAFMIVYTFFEGNMARVARTTKSDLNNHKKNKITASPANNYLYGSMGFLKKHCSLKLGARENIYKKLDKLRDYRNFIAHNNSNLKQTGNPLEAAKKKKTVNYINRVFGKSIKIDQLGQCNIENTQLLSTTLQLMETYLYFVIDKGMKKCR